MLNLSFDRALSAVQQPAPDGSLPELPPGMKFEPTKITDEGGASYDALRLMVRVELLLDNPYPHRSSRTDDEYSAVETSILNVGQKQPIVVRMSKNSPGFFEIAAGHTRRDVYKNNEKEWIWADLQNLNEEQMLEVGFVENYSRNQTCILDVVDSLLGLCDFAGLQPQNVPAAARRLERNACDAETSILKTVLDKYAIKPGTFRRNLEILDKPEEVLNAIREKKISFTVGRLIAAISDELIREQVLDWAILNSPSKSELQARIRELTPRPRRQAQTNAYRERFVSLAKTDIPQNVADEVSKLLDKIEQLIGEK